MFPARPASAGPVTPSGARASRDAADFIALANTAPAAAAAVAKPPPISLVEQLRAKEEEARRKKRARAAKEAAGGDLTAVPDDLLSALSFSESTAAADAARRGERARWEARVRAKREAMRSGVHVEAALHHPQVRAPFARARAASASRARDRLCSSATERRSRRERTSDKLWRGTAGRPHALRRARRTAEPLACRARPDALRRLSLVFSRRLSCLPSQVSAVLNPQRAAAVKLRLARASDATSVGGAGGLEMPSAGGDSDGGDGGTGGSGGSAVRRPEDCSRDGYSSWSTRPTLTKLGLSTRRVGPRTTTATTRSSSTTKGPPTARSTTTTDRARRYRAATAAARARAPLLQRRAAVS